jgi:hypothetical protein
MKRIYKIILATLLIPIGAIVLYIFVITPVIRLKWEARTRNESTRILDDLDPVKESANIHGPSSISLFLTYPDDAWIAFLYRDSHAGGIFSSTIVRDSGGQWFESNHHFCGLLVYYRQTYRMQNIAREVGDTEEVAIPSSCSGIDAVAVSKNLKDARTQLLKLGFATMNR